jgi:hypothetical protein
MTDTWTTRLEPELERELGRRYGHTQPIHNAWFEPPAWSERREIVTLGDPRMRIAALHGDERCADRLHQPPTAERSQRQKVDPRHVRDRGGAQGMD